MQRGRYLAKIHSRMDSTSIKHEATAALANTVHRALTLDELHRRMGHISPQIARKLVRDGTVEGLIVDPSSQPTLSP